MPYPDHLLKLINIFKKFPGVGSKSAERFAFHLLDWPEEKQEEMALLIQQTHLKLKTCPECGCLIESDVCSFCYDPKRSPELLCVTASLKDVFHIEQTHAFKGLYHVLGGLLNPLHGRALIPQALETLKARITTRGVKELILALDSTLEGDATALYLKKELELLGVEISRPALGLPMGSSLEFVDGGTLARALAGRHKY